MISTARLRAHQVLQDAGLRDAGSLERAPSAVNEVWYCGPYVMRISATPGGRRLEYEAEVAGLLPAEVGYPEIVKYGQADFGEWLITRRVGGQVLSRAWPTMRETARQEAVHQLGVALEAVHQVRPAKGAGALRPPFLGEQSLECPHQLPVPRLLRLIRRAAGLPFVDKAMLEALTARVERAAEALDDGDDDRLIHGDLHLENVLWDGARVTAVLDFEWARPAAPDLDLDVLLRFCADPALHVGDDYRDRTRKEDYRPVPGWLKQAYPALFAHPRLNDRLFVYCVSYDVRALLVDPPRRPVDRLAPLHPYNRLRLLLDGRGHLPWIDW